MAESKGMSVAGLTAGYRTVRVLRDADVTVSPGECVTVLGANGAGKTTLVRAIAGFADVFAGRVTADGVDVTEMKPFRRVRAGIAQVPEGRRLFASLDVVENLQIALHWKKLSRSAEQAALDQAFDLFPRLQERQHQRVGSMSGGEQQMLAIARAVVLEPRYLLLDEPSTGLAPVLVDVVFDAVSRLRELGSIGLFVVEQNPAILDIADRAYVMRSGRIVAGGPASSFAIAEMLGRAYVGSLKGEQEGKEQQDG